MYKLIIFVFFFTSFTTKAQTHRNLLTKTEAFRHLATQPATCDQVYSAATCTYGHPYVQTSPNSDSHKSPITEQHSIRSDKQFLQITSLEVPLPLSTSALKSPGTVAPDGAPSSTPPRDSKKAGCRPEGRRRTV